MTEVVNEAGGPPIQEFVVHQGDAVHQLGRHHQCSGVEQSEQLSNEWHITENTKSAALFNYMQWRRRKGEDASLYS